MSASQKVLWAPNPGPQTALIECPVREVFFGGARGGGKTEGSIGDWLQHQQTFGRAANGVFFRREERQLDEVIRRTQQIFPQLGAKFQSQKSTWTMANGAQLKFRYLDKDRDAEAYQGHSYTRLYIEEATNFPSFAPIKLLLGTLRSGEGAHCGMRLTGNPGGPGHRWVFDRYIKPAPGGFRVLRELIEVDGFGTLEHERCFIPSRIQDNPLLMRNDPQYIANLALSGSRELVRAWLLGDWNSPVGAYFTQFTALRHVLPAKYARLIPRQALRFGSIDWGYAKPFSFGHWVVSDGTWGLPRGALVRVQEWYGSNGKPNEGLRLDAPLVAQGILQRLQGANLTFIVADPSMFKRDGGPSLAETFAVNGVTLRRADNSRVAGWDKVRQHLNGWLGRLEDRPDGPLPPLMYFLDNCQDTIRTFESVPSDPDNPDDVNTKAEEHAADDVRYAVMSRPWIIDSLPPVPERPARCLEALWEEADRSQPLELI